MHHLLTEKGDQTWFQSAPDREVGRCTVTGRVTFAANKFQSAPDREVGRCSGIETA